MIYLDHAATSPTSRAALSAMWPYMTDQFANASSQHEAGKLAAAGLQAAREVIAEICKANPNEILFTSGGTESNNAAIKGLALANPKGRHIITTPIEHEAVLESCNYLARFHDFRISHLQVDNEGFINTDELVSLIDDDTTLVSIQYANNEVGTIQDVNTVAERCSERNVPFHTDAVQAAGYLPLDAKADLISISVHKFGGPKGVGALIKRGATFLEPLIHGGGQEFGLRSGTSNVTAAVGMAAALHERQSMPAQDIINLRDQLISGILKTAPNAQLTGSPTRLPNHASFVFEGVSGESILLDLEARGIACSSGSACASDKQEPSYVLLAMGYTPEIAETAVRFTLGPENTADEINKVIEYFKERHAARDL